MTISKRKLHTAVAIIGASAVFVPNLQTLAAWLAAHHITWLSVVSQVVGWIATLLTAWPAIVGKAKPIVDIVEAAQVEEVTKPEKNL
jgi:hypothetical protein